MSGRQWIIAAVVVVLLAGCYFAAQYLLQPPSKPSVDEGRMIAESFLVRLREGKAGEAWDGATAEFKSIEGRESFTRKVKSAAILKEPLHFGSVQNVMVQQSPRSEFLFNSSGAGGMVRVLIGREQGQWKVDRLTF